jgi:hypothetical protein
VLEFDTGGVGDVADREHDARRQVRRSKLNPRTFASNSDGHIDTAPELIISLGDANSEQDPHSLPRNGRYCETLPCYDAPFSIGGGQE